MDLEQFLSSLELSEAPTHLTLPLQAMWYARNSQWDHAHELVQDGADRASAHVHAYLHREEGDNANAHYWYSRAQRSPYSGSLESEWREIVVELLHRGA